MSQKLRFIGFIGDWAKFCPKICLPTQSWTKYLEQSSEI